MRNKWTWDRVVRGSHGTNCTGNCAFNVYVRNGIVWREEQQGEYPQPVDDAPDFGPRGCQKGLRHAKYMYGPQRILYPLKRVGERGSGKWERVSWEQATDEIADRYIDTVMEHGTRSVSMGLGTQMVLKRAAFAAFARFGTIAGAEMPESFAGVGDLPTGVMMTVGDPLLGDTMTAVYKSRCCLIWYCNPAVTRIPDAHFFWEARYNGTEVITIAPEFNPSAMHASKWLNPKPGTDAALAMGMVQVILADKAYDAPYLKEQTDMPYLVRVADGKFLRETDLSDDADARDDQFYVWDRNSGGLARAPGSGFNMPPPGQPSDTETKSLALGQLEPTLEGSWTIDAKGESIEVTTVFELLKKEVAERYTPAQVSEITGLNPSVIEQTARKFAAAKPAMIFSGYRVCKWLHGDLMQRSFLLLLSLTGNIGKEGGGLQIWNMPSEHDQLAFIFEGIPPTFRVATMARWDYAHTDGRSLNEEMYGKELADHFESYHQKSMTEGAFPDYSKVPWKMGIFMGLNPANWRGSSERWRKTGLEELDTIVAAAPDMGATPMFADYVLPSAAHYERVDFLLEPRTPYAQIMDAAVPPLGESQDDFIVMERLAAAISRRAKARGIEPIMDEFMGQPLPRDLTQFHALYTKNETIKSNTDIVQFLLDHNPGIRDTSVAEFADKGVIQTEASDGVIYDHGSVYQTTIIRSVRDKKPYKTLTGRQQFYMDHDWFMEEGESFPGYREPLAVEGYPLRMLMGHARHGIHSMWRDDSLLVSLQRGEPDIYVNPEDAAERGVEDGNLIRVFNKLGDFIAIAHVTSAIQPGMTFMYHGWDPVMFRGKRNFGAVVASSALIKPTSIVSGYGHVTYRPLAFEPNITIQDFTLNFEKYAERATA